MDWSAIILQLRKHYGPCRKIDKAIGRHVDYAAKIGRGEIEEPKFSDGLQLLRLALDHLPREQVGALRIDAEIGSLTERLLNLQPTRPRNPGIFIKHDEARP